MLARVLPGSAAPDQAGGETAETQSQDTAHRQATDEQLQKEIQDKLHVGRGAYGFEGNRKPAAVE
jgi:hypothetical protein